jgi:hypothetical protein
MMRHHPQVSDRVVDLQVAVIVGLDQNGPVIVVNPVIVVKIALFARAMWNL